MKHSEEECWIPARVSSGMFSSEYAISVQTADGHDVSFFADKSLVKEQGNDSFVVKVTVVQVDPTKHKKRVLLPTEAFETSSRWVEVKTK